MTEIYEKTNKQLIYDTAKKLFFTEGYQVGFRRIAQKIGISQGLITYHFKTKRNIAIEIYKEDYQILSTYLKYSINPDEDSYLYVVGLYELTSRIYKANPEKLNFVRETQLENIGSEAIYVSGFKQIYLKLIEDMKPNGYSKEKNLTLFLCTTYAAYGAILQKQSEGFDLSDDESLFHSVDLMYYCLGHDRDPKRTTDIIQKAKERIDSLLQKYPHLLDIHQYLIK